MSGLNGVCVAWVRRWVAMAALCAGVSWSAVGAVSPKSLYCVIDLSGGENTDSYPVTYLDALPTDNADKMWEYKTKKIVLRRIESGTYKMQNVKDVTLTRAYYIGVFEVTQKQYALVMGTNPSTYRTGDGAPVESVSWIAARGTANWPTDRTVDADSFIGRIRARTGLLIDLPTYAQWQYACRAGGDELYDREAYDSSTLEVIARYQGNRPTSPYTEMHATVGSYKPNAWGLYDMIGNVNEWCLDWYSDTLTYGVNPVGATTGEKRVICGGAWWTTVVSSLFSNFTLNASYPDTDNDSKGDLAGIGLRLVGNTDGEVDSLRITAISVDEELRTATLEAAYSMAWGEPDPVDFKVKHFAALDEVETQVLEPVAIPVLDRERGLATLTVNLPEGALGFMRAIVVE